MSASAITDSTITLEAPTVGNVQLMSAMIYINSSETNPKTLNVPANAVSNGAGENNSLSTRNVPILLANDVSGVNNSTITSTRVNFATNGSGSYSLDGGLDTFGAVLISLRF